MGLIPFTQYLLPHGNKRRISVEVPDSVSGKAKKLIGADCHFDIEILNTGMVSMTCETNPGKGDPLLAIEICENGPGIEDYVKKLVEQALVELDRRLVKEMTKDILKDMVSR